MKLTILTILSLTSLVICQDCHYSCALCSDKYYSHCLTCADPAKAIIPVAESSSGSVGICTAAAFSSGNGLGIVLVIISVLGGSLLKSQYVFQIILALQSLALLSFVEIAYPFSLSVIFGSFQYLMLFSIMQQGAKIDDGQLLQRSMYRLDDFLRTINFTQNFSPLFAMNIIAALMLVFGIAFRALRGNRCKGLSDAVLGHILVGLRTFLLLISQETVLIAFAGIRFWALSGSEIFMITLYLLILVFLVVDCNLHMLPFFRSSQLMNLAFAKRLVLPAVAILPFKFTYNLIIFLLGFAIIELLLLTKSRAKPRNYLYSVAEILSLLFLSGLFISDLAINSHQQSYAMGIVTTISFSLYYGGYFLELCLAVKSKVVSGNKIDNQEWEFRVETSEKISALRDQDTLQTNQMEESKTPQQKLAKYPTIEEKLPNLLEGTRRQEKKFKTNKN